MKRKGSSLIMVLCVVALLSALTLILVTGATSAYNLTSTNEKKDKTYLLAESGVEMGFNKIKETLKNNPGLIYGTSVYDNTALSQFDFNGEDENGRIWVKFQNCPKYKNLEDIEDPAIEITSTAKTSIATQREKTKTIKVTILKRDITNPYYDLLTGNVMTTLDEKKDSNDSFVAKFDQTPIRVDGNMYLQGGNILFCPGIFSEYNKATNIKINAKNLLMDINTEYLGNFFNEVKDRMIVNEEITTYRSVFGGPKGKYEKLSIKDGLHKVDNMPEYKKLNVNSNDLKDVDSLEPLERHIDLVNLVDKYGKYDIQIGSKKITDNNNNKKEVLVIKIITKDPKDNDSKFKWSEFQVLLEDHIKDKAEEQYKEEYKANHPYWKLELVEMELGALLARKQALDDFNYNVFRVYIIDGNVDINAFSSNGFLHNEFYNSIIYCTRKLSFGADGLEGLIRVNGLKSINFNNSAVLANQIEVNDLNGVGLTFQKLQSDFDKIYKATVSDILCQNLEGYADKYKFKIYKWEES